MTKSRKDLTTELIHIVSDQKDQLEELEALKLKHKNLPAQRFFQRAELALH